VAPRRALLAVLALAAACGGGGAGELMETAAFEELQNNSAHARQLYEEVVAKYPDSPEAKKAAERLRALGAD
jgi:hypothetical protein